MIFENGLKIKLFFLIIIMERVKQYYEKYSQNINMNIIGLIFLLYFYNLTFAVSNVLAYTDLFTKIMYENSGNNEISKKKHVFDLISMYCISTFLNHSLNFDTLFFMFYMFNLFFMVDLFNNRNILNYVSNKLNFMFQINQYSIAKTNDYLNTNVSKYYSSLKTLCMSYIVNDSSKNYISNTVNNLSNKLNINFENLYSKIKISIVSTISNYKETNVHNDIDNIIEMHNSNGEITESVTNNEIIESVTNNEIIESVTNNEIIETVTNNEIIESVTNNEIIKSVINNEITECENKGEESIESESINNIENTEAEKVLELIMENVENMAIIKNSDGDINIDTNIENTEGDYNIDNIDENLASKEAIDLANQEAIDEELNLKKKKILIKPKKKN